MFSSRFGFYHAKDFPFLFTVISLLSCHVNSVTLFMVGWFCPSLLFNLMQCLTVFGNSPFFLNNSLKTEPLIYFLFIVAQGVVKGRRGTQLQRYTDLFGLHSSESL